MMKNESKENTSSDKEHTYSDLLLFLEKYNAETIGHNSLFWFSLGIQKEFSQSLKKTYDSISN